MQLIGINEICKFMGLSESSTLDLILKSDLPAEQNEDCIWEADSDAVEVWKGRKEAARKPKAGAAEKIIPKDRTEASVQKTGKYGKRKSKGGDR